MPLTRDKLEFSETYGPIEAFLPEIGAPTLLVWGAGDPILKPSLGKKTQRTIEGSVAQWPRKKSIVACS